MKTGATLLLSLLLSPVHGLTSASTTIWFGKPGVIWTDALPVGNGRLGAVIHGGYGMEQVGLNEDSIWSGGLQKRINSNALAAFPGISEAFTNGNISKADEIWHNNLKGTGTQVRQYQPAGNMMIEFGQNVSRVSGYNRSLDLTTGENHVSYTRNDVTYLRQALASYPHDTLGFRYTADKAGALDMKISLTRNESVTGLKVDLEKLSITMYGQGTNDSSLKFVHSIRVVADTGNFTSNSTSLILKGGKEVRIYYGAETTFRHANVEAAEAAMNAKLDAAVAVPWEEFKSKAIEDYKNLADRVQLDVGSSGEIGRLDTGQRLKNWNTTGNATSDPELMALTYNYGRFLLIGSSRIGSLPSNLQGVWNDKFKPPWGSRFTININTEMNYWPAETTNLAETHLPVFDHLLRMQEQGRYVAKGMYNMSGWVCHHNTDLWGDCVPVDDQTYWAANPVGGAWLALHLIEHFRFNGNTTWASSTALPILSDALTFFYDFSIKKGDYNALIYDSSPENSYHIPSNKQVPNATTGIDQGSAHPRQVLHELFSGFIEMSEATGSIDGVAKAKDYLAHIEPPNVGTDGHLLEWSGDFKETEPGHRHLSHLLGVYPGGHISPLINKTASDAALVSLDNRIAASTDPIGWSKVWAAGIYARLFDGDKAAFHLCDLISNYLAGNLFDLNIGVFQIDGNLGFTGSMTELFLQSHAGVVHLAPALPSNLIPEGSVSGLVARGGFVVSVKWKDHKFVEATVEVQRGGLLKLRVEDGREFKVDGLAYDGSIETSAAVVYKISI
ncbi:hypothetical protein HBH68_096570 [Parastagonospora nodorum]|nr:hypothetical protein HBH46_051160 [Parastagonospora nodorum]KAH4195817.1 hypothetical protein HBH42_077330 [Parastagonospora nodorum]KAH4847888.1 hypothetical protein HBH75_157090 [Parastagonospora nodorum]KAH5204922.1 hypothetical protein HBH68_096570 [Parastagonospora nodorum]KAH5714628.1 hypothetical protein HBI20_151460 [Parastagonospora nodorum]